MKFAVFICLLLCLSSSVSALRNLSTDNILSDLRALKRICATHSKKGSSKGNIFALIKAKIEKKRREIEEKKRRAAAEKKKK